jgi:hypothetical protein
MTQRVERSGRHLTKPIFYEIHVKEPIDSCWASWFEGMTISQAENGEMILSGPVVDKSALHGLLANIGELNLTLISVVQLKSPNPSTGGNHEK